MAMPSRRTSQRTSRQRPSSARPRSNNRPAGKLRLIGGHYRRRELSVVDLPGLRPTPARTRETLFNWIGQTTEGLRVLDLYAGTGALGLEAMSRGASSVVLVERQPAAVNQLNANIDTLGVDNARVVQDDVTHFLQNGPVEPVDLVFMDPPFHQGLAFESCQRLEALGWMRPNAYIYLETEAGPACSVPASWQLLRESRAGESLGRLFRHQPASPLAGTQQ